MQGNKHFFQAWSFWWHDEEMGPLMAQWKIFEPFDDAMGKLETLNKIMGKLWGWLITWWEYAKLDPGWGNGTFGALWWCNGQIRDPSNGKTGPPDDLMGELEALDLLMMMGNYRSSFWWHDEEMGPLMAQWKLFGPKCNKLGNKLCTRCSGIITQ